MMSLCAMLVVLAMTLAAVVSSHHAVHDEAKARFARISERLTSEACRRVNQVQYGLKGARGVYAASKSVERAEFAAYVASRNLASEFSGAIGFGFIERVMRSDLGSFVERERADGAPEFAVFGLAPSHSPLSAREDLYVIKHCFPRDRNAAAWGLDVGSERHRREAAEQAAMSGAPSITAKISLVQDGTQRTGFLYFLPVYASGTDAETAEGRLATLVGLVYAPIILEEALADVAEIAEGQLDFEVFDGDALCKETQLFDHDRHLDQVTGEITKSDYAGRMFESATRIVIGGRVWTLTTSTTPTFDATVDQSTTWALGIGGLLVSLLGACFTYALTTARARAVAIARNMTADLSYAKHAAEAALREIGVLHSTLDAHSIVSVADAQGRIIAVNNEFCRISGYAADELMGQDHRILNSGMHPKAFWVEVWRTLASGSTWRGEVCNKAKDGSMYWVDSIIAPFLGASGKIEKYVSIRNDITSRKAAERELERMALTDRLTGLPNRALVTDRLERVMVRAAREQRAEYAVLFLDFDRFKVVNDTLGHEAGDALLIGISNRLRKTLRQTDSVARVEVEHEHTAARMGGDEFVVVLDGLARPEDADEVAARLVQVMSEPHSIAGQIVVSTASIGLVRGDLRYQHPADVLRDADSAMYQAKNAGKGRYAIFDDQMREKMLRRQALERDIRGVASRGELSPRFQPIMELGGSRVDAIEVLVRWEHPRFGPVNAAEFISIAEDMGEIAAIDAWVMETVCAQIKVWRRELGEALTPRLNVNLSRSQFRSSDLVQQLIVAVTTADVEIEAIGLEISERIVSRDPKSAIPVIRQLREAGFLVVLDDFGTGYASLPMLHELPIQAVKLDQAFVANAARGREYASLAQVVVTLARNLGLAVVAEGVENAEQLAVLQAMDCRLAQGRLLAAEMTSEEMTRLLRAGAIGDSRREAA